MTCVYIEFHGREMRCSFYTKLILNLTWKYNVYALWVDELLFIFPFCVLFCVTKILYKKQMTRDHFQVIYYPEMPQGCI